MQLQPETVALIMKILRRGNTVELKKEKHRLVVVEIDRKARAKVDMPEQTGSAKS